MKSFIAKPHEIEREWFVVDAEGKTLGRLATQIATILRGKHKPIYTPHVDCGDFVIVVNAEKIKVTGNKAEQKKYRWHTGYVGHLKERGFQEMKQKRPTRILELAVKGMLPHTSLGAQMYRKLKVYAGSEHKHEAQSPKALDI